MRVLYLVPLRGKRHFNKHKLKIFPISFTYFGWLTDLFRSILMKGITWSRDSHGLFDYESRHLTKKTLKADKPVMIMRSGNELGLIPYDAGTSFQEQITLNTTQADDKALLKIVNHNDSTFYLESAAF